MILYYQEDCGDYLAIDTATNRHYLGSFGQDYFEGRATAIAGLVGSVCTTADLQGISADQLQTGTEGESAGRVAQGYRLRMHPLPPHSLSRRRRFHIHGLPRGSDWFLFVWTR